MSRLSSTGKSLAARLILIAALLAIVNPAPVSHQIGQWWNMAQGRDYERVRVAFNQILDRTASPITVYEHLIEISLLAEHYNDAQIYLYALADLDGWDANRRLQLNMILEKSGQTDWAATLLASAPNEYSDSQALSFLASQQIEQHDWQQARTNLEQIVLIDPENTQAFYQLGLLIAPEDPVMAAGYLDRAAADPELSSRVELVKAALVRYETNILADAHTSLGITLVGLSEWPFAERTLEFALSVNAVNPTALAYLGFVRDQQGRDGLSDLEAAQAMAPGDPTVLFLLGQHWRQMDDHDAAYNAFVEAYRLDPDNPALAAEVGTSLQLMGELSEAEGWLRTAVELAPLDPRWYGLLAAFYADTGYELETIGLPFIEEAVQLVPQDSDIHASLGWVYYQLGEYGNAYEQLNTAVSLDPDHPRTRYYFAVVLEYMGDRAGAADSYRFVVAELGSETGFGLLAARSLERIGQG